MRYSRILRNSIFLLLCLAAVAWPISLASISGSGGALAPAGPPSIALGINDDPAASDSTYSTPSFAVSGSNVALLACIHNIHVVSGSQVTSSVKWNTTESFTQIVSQGTEPADTQNISFWYLANPTQTTSQIDVVYVDRSTSIAHVMILTGASQTNPTISNSGTCSSCTLATINVTSTVNNSLMAMCVGTADSRTFTYGTGQSVISYVHNLNSPDFTSAVSYEVKATAGIETLTSTGNASGTYRYVAIVVPPAS